MPYDETRGRGILSEADRRYLRNPDEYASEHQRQSVTERRNAIRDRVKNGMQDFALLFRQLSDDDLEEIFTPSLEVHEGDEGEETLRGTGDAAAAYIPQAIAFLARASDLDNATIYPQLGTDQPALTDFAHHTESGLKSWLAREKRMAADVEVEIGLEDAQPIDEVVEEARQEDTAVSRSLQGMELARLTVADLTDEEMDALIAARDAQKAEEDTDEE